MERLGLAASKEKLQMTFFFFFFFSRRHLGFQQGSNVASRAGCNWTLGQVLRNLESKLHPCNFSLQELGDCQDTC